MPTMSIWKPELACSVDGQPVITRVRELLPSHFPYDRLPTNATAAFFLRPEVVLALVAFYLVSKPIIKQIGTNLLQISPTSATFRHAIALHNLGLAIFSAVVAYNSWLATIQFYLDHDFMSLYCDKDNSFWNEGGLGAWSMIFFISKFYEFADTWILVLKGKPASFLQVYHHTGIVLAMWGGVLSQGAWLLFVVLYNSLIHAIMYTYFWIKTLWPKTEIKAARYLTMAQIGQFLVGITSSAGVLIMGDSCDTESSRASLAFLQIYGFGLIALFVSFAQKKYKKA